MLTPTKIAQLFNQLAAKHTRAQFGLYPPQKKIINYICNQLSRIQKDQELEEIQKVSQMTNVLEGFIRYLNDTNMILKLDVEKILTYIYYPESEKITLENKDNLLLGSKGATVQQWHDAYFINNRKPIINRLIDCKNVLYNKITKSNYHDIETHMPDQMRRKYQEMLLESRQ